MTNHRKPKGSTWSESRVTIFNFAALHIFGSRKARHFKFTAWIELYSYQLERDNLN